MTTEPENSYRSWTEDPIEELIARCLELEETLGPKAVEALIAEHPEAAAEIRAGLAMGRELGLLEAPRVAAPPSHLGDFRILERLGGGGMGFVYRAVQERLDREVAVKIIRPEYVFSEAARERFRREALAVARLQHPGIVQLFSVGDEAGVPYLSMELVKGVPLSDVLSDLEAHGLEGVDGRTLRRLVGPSGSDADFSPASSSHAAVFDGSWVQACLRLVRQVAEALEHAHARGVVHRDVKPSNLMLTSSGRLLLLDFGLARDTALSRMTATASEVGSLAYMAPERLEGRSDTDDTLADIYGLGVTLYELLALRLPYQGRTHEHTRSLILEGRAPSLRRLNPSVPWEVETVCAAAMDPDPSRRYRTAADLARDLGSALDGRPIEARRSGLLRRAHRFVRRRPAMSAAVALAVGLFVVAPSLHAWRQGRILEQVRAERERAEGLTRLSNETRRFLFEIVDAGDAWTWLREGLSDPARVEERARAIVEGAGDRELRGHVAQTLAIACLELGLDEVGEDLVKLAMEERARWGATAAEHRHLLVQHAKLLLRQGRFPELGRVVDTVIRDVEASGDAPSLSLALAWSYRVEILRHGGRLRESLEAQEHTLELFETVPYPRASERARTLAVHRSILGTILRELGDLERAEQVSRAAVEALSETGDEQSEARSRQDLAAVLRKRGDIEGAIVEMRRVVDTFRSSLPAGHPRIARAEMDLGKALHGAGRRREARPLLEAAFAHRDELPSGPVAEAATLLGIDREVGGDLDGALRCFEGAVELIDKASGDRRRQAANYRVHLGRVLRRTDASAAAFLHLEAAAHILAELEDPRVAWAWQLQVELAQVHRDLGRSRAAATAWLEAARLTPDPTRAGRYAKLAAEVFQELGDDQDALVAWRLAVARLGSVPAASASLQEAQQRCTDLEARGKGSAAIDGDGAAPPSGSGARRSGDHQ